RVAPPAVSMNDGPGATATRSDRKPETWPVTHKRSFRLSHCHRDNGSIMSCRGFHHVLSARPRTAACRSPLWRFVARVRPIRPRTTGGRGIHVHAHRRGPTRIAQGMDILGAEDTGLSRMQGVLRAHRVVVHAVARHGLAERAAYERERARRLAVVV